MSHPEFLGVKASASQEEVVKASRKKGRLIHPDKAKQSLIASRAKATPKPLLGQEKKPGVNVNKPPSEGEIQAAIQKASERYARLGVITEILKGPGRERYDYFLGAGFPKWRGTGYYYARFRPGLGSVLVGLFVFCGGLVHYGALYLSWKRQRDFVERLIRDARKAAWGDESGIKGIPGVDGALAGTTATAPPPTPTQKNGAAVLNRRQKRMQEKESKKEDKKSKGARQSGTNTPLESEPEATGPQGSKKKVQAPNGKVMIVDSIGNVFLEQENEEGERQEYLLDPNELPKPTFRETVLFWLPVWAYSKIKSRITGAQSDYEEAELKLLEASSSEVDEGPGQDQKSSINGSARKRGQRNGKVQ
jgi:curved DNA-binding protein CbpA